MSARGVLIVLGWLAANIAAAGVASTQTFVPPTPRPKSSQAKLHYILPPVQYDHFYEGDLTIEIVPTLDDLYGVCNMRSDKLLACSISNAKSCAIYMVEDKIMRKRGWTTGLLLRHEIGHCNGWPGDHPGERALTAPSTHWVPAQERIR